MLRPTSSVRSSPAIPRTCCSSTATRSPTAPSCRTTTSCTTSSRTAGSPGEHRGRGTRPGPGAHARHRHRATRHAAALTRPGRRRPDGGTHGQADLLGDHVARRLRRRRGRQLRLGGARRGGARASSTTSSGRSAPTSTGAGCTRRWSTGRPRTPSPTSRPSSGTSRGIWRAADKIVYSTTLGDGVERQDADRARLRPGRRPAAEGGGRARPHRRRRPTSPPRRSRPGWSTSATCSSRRSSVGGGSRRCLDQVRLKLALRGGAAVRQRRRLPAPTAQSRDHARAFRHAPHDPGGRRRSDSNRVSGDTYPRSASAEL